MARLVRADRKILILYNHDEQKTITSNLEVNGLQKEAGAEDHLSAKNRNL